METLDSKNPSAKKGSKISVKSLSPRSPRKTERSSQPGSPRKEIQTTGYIKEKDGADEAATIVKAAKHR